MVLLIVAGCFFGVISSTVGSAALITVPFLLVFGLSSTVAIATNKFAVLSSFVTGSTKYYRKGVLKYGRLLLLLSIVSIVGSIIGAHIVLHIEQKTLRLVIVFLLIMVLAFTLRRKDHIQTASVKNYPLGVIAVFLLAIYSGFFGAGFGSFLISSLMYFFGIEYLESAALMNVINFFAILPATLIFMTRGTINYSYGIPLLIGFAIGGWIGAHYAVLKGNKFLRKMFVVITSILLFKVIFDLVQTF